MRVFGDTFRPAGTVHRGGWAVSTNILSLKGHKGCFSSSISSHATVKQWIIENIATGLRVYFIKTENRDFRINYFIH
jgi:hypothetical protein